SSKIAMAWSNASVAASPRPGSTPVLDPFGRNHDQRPANFAQLVIHEKDTSVFPDGLRTMGTALLRQGNPQEAEQYVQQSIEFTQQNQDRYLEAYGWRAMVEVYQVQGQDEDATDAFDQAIAIFEELGLDKEIEKTKMIMNSG
ncbi:MAG: tetratricopeptide repeat protein, partial [Chloroflexota bacterium]